MSQFINQSGLFSAVRTDNAALIDDARLRSGQDTSLRPGLKLICILAVSAILWAGIFLLAQCTLHLLHLR
jgi:hypothetical protein